MKNSRDFVVTVYIVHDKKVLLIHHKKLNMWLPVGGHVEKDETPDEALVREVMEEVGIEIEFLESQKRIDEDAIKLLTPNHIQLEDIHPGHQHIDLVYFAKAKNTEIKKSDEHNDAKWFSLDELKNTKGSVKIFGRMAIEKIW